MRRVEHNLLIVCFGSIHTIEAPEEPPLLLFCCLFQRICSYVWYTHNEFPLECRALRAFTTLKLILDVLVFLNRNHSVTLWVVGYVVILSCTWVPRLQRISKFLSRQENYFTWMEIRLPHWLWMMPPKLAERKRPIQLSSSLKIASWHTIWFWLVSCCCGISIPEHRILYCY